MIKPIYEQEPSNKNTFMDITDLPEPRDAKRDELEAESRLLRAAYLEPELPGPMPEEMWQNLKSLVHNDDKAGVEAWIRSVVNLTKRGIAKTALNNLNRW